ncbi:hypothetical protein CEXT_598671 [Caerostris extrusa]|uniref:Uncharacterized protein n=1 Tax=Caerostris extrusa TaxID=172846 RepID=A0AAV4UTL2_CAEEX|nr:hypothetical protein CEXT_598671 [Caerostris extrusa]
MSGVDKLMASVIRWGRSQASLTALRNIKRLNSSVVEHHPVGISHLDAKRRTLGKQTVQVCQENGTSNNSFYEENDSNDSVTHQTLPHIHLVTVLACSRTTLGCSEPQIRTL